MFVGTSYNPWAWYAKIPFPSASVGRRSRTLTTFAATFLTASLVLAVNRTFHGEEPLLVESMRAA